MILSNDHQSSRKCWQLLLLVTRNKSLRLMYVTWNTAEHGSVCVILTGHVIDGVKQPSLRSTEFIDHGLGETHSKIDRSSPALRWEGSDGQMCALDCSQPSWPGSDLKNSVAFKDHVVVDFEPGSCTYHLAIKVWKGGGFFFPSGLFLSVFCLVCPFLGVFLASWRGRPSTRLP